MFNASSTLGLKAASFGNLFIITESSEQSTELDLEFNFRFSAQKLHRIFHL